MSHDVGVESGGLSGGDQAPRAQESAEPIYRARRDPTAPVGSQIVVTVNGEPMDYRYDLLSASPSGFEWGYGGSGPAQLAVALLAHALDDEVAVTYYQRFKREVVSQLPEAGWKLSADDVRRWYAEVAGGA